MIMISHKRVEGWKTVLKRQYLVASILGSVKQRLVSIITSTLNQDLNLTCKLLDYTLDSSISQLDLCTRNFSSFSFPVEQVQTVYRLLARGEPASLERLCMGISLANSDERDEDEEKEEKEIINWYTGAVKRKEETVSKVLVYNSYFYPTLERMKKLRHVVLHGVCDNQTLSIMGQNCNVLQFLDLTGSADVTDVGIQNLVFPLSVQKAGRVNLVNTRAKTNPSAKQLHTVLVRGTGVDVTGCIILLQFCPRLTKGGGHLEHDNIGEAIYILNKKLKVTSIMLKELIDAEIDEQKEAVFSQIICKLESLKTSGKCLTRIQSLFSPNNSISELYLDFLHQDFRSDLISFLGIYPGANLKVLEIRNMDDPLEIDIISEECSNLVNLRMMLCGVMGNSHTQTNSHFPKLTKLNMRTSNPETMLSFMRNNVSVRDLKISCPNEGKSKFTDVFIQTVCGFKGFLPSLKTLRFSSKFSFGFTSAQKLIESLISLEYIGPLEMLTKLSKPDVNDLVNWVKENNWNVILGYKGAQYNVFNIDQSDPWKHKYIPDKGRIPVKKEKSVYKRTLSVPTGLSDDEDEISFFSDGRKRSRTNSVFLSPSQCSVRKSGSLISLKKSNGSNRTSVNLENEEFEFEFAMDSDGFIKNKDYKLYNHQIAQFENDEDYDDYDEFDEDTMDVEDLPEDAEFEWCWGEDGNLKIYEIDKTGKEEDTEEGANGSILTKEEQSFLGNKEYEFSLEGNVILPEHNKEDYKLEEPIDEKMDSTTFSKVQSKEAVIETPVPEIKETPANPEIDAVSSHDPVTISRSKSYSATQTKSRSKVKSPSLLSSKEETEVSTSSRRAKKRYAPLSPPPVIEDKLISQNETAPVSSASKSLNGITESRSSLIPPKAAKSDAESNKMGKISSIFQKSDPGKLTTNIKPNSINVNNVSNTSNSSIGGELLKKAPVLLAPIKTQVIEVFEYDPLLGYCTVKRKTVPIDEKETLSEPSKSINISYLKTSDSEKPTQEISPNDNSENMAQQSLTVTDTIGKTKSILSQSTPSPAMDDLISPVASLSQKAESNPSSNTSSKENKVPNKSPSKKSSIETEPSKPLIPMSSMSKYDIPFLGVLFAANNGKSIPGPPKCKPPSLPPNIEKALPKLSRPAPEETPKISSEPKPQPKLDIKVELVKEKDTVINVTIPKPEKHAQKHKSSKPEEAKEWYWDYEENCWKECDPEEEYEWEYIESDEEKEKEPVQHEVIVLPRKTNSVQNEESIISKNVCSTPGTEKDNSKLPDLQKDARNEKKHYGSQDLLNVSEDEEELSPLLSDAYDKDLETDRKHASRWGKSRKRSGKLARQTTVEDDVSESLSVSQEDLLDHSSPRRRKKGVVDPPPKHSLYDLSYFDDEPVSALEVSQRARRRRKDTEEEKETRIQEEKQKEPKASQDDLSRKDKMDAQMKRRNTGKKMDGEKARVSATKLEKAPTTKQEKKSEIRKRDQDRGSDMESTNHFKSNIQDSDEPAEDEPDEKNVTFCMWGHENCRTRSHYRYNWQWDYVQKYADQHNKNMIQGYQPREERSSRPAEEQPQDIKDKKPSKDGIKIRLQMLQNKFSSGKTSTSVKLNQFERDLELEMLRRKKNYKY